MTDAWDKRAAKVQQSVREGEDEDSTEYSDTRVKRAVVHARDDMVLLVSNLSSANGHLSAILKVLIFIAAVLLYIAYRLS